MSTGDGEADRALRAENLAGRVIGVVDKADVLTAIGTVGAVIVALVLAAFPAIRRHFKKPSVTVSAGLTEPYVRPIAEGTSIASEVRLRVGVTNVGKATAQGVRA